MWVTVHGNLREVENELNGCKRLEKREDGVAEEEKAASVNQQPRPVDD